MDHCCEDKAQELVKLRERQGGVLRIVLGRVERQSRQGLPSDVDLGLAPALVEVPVAAAPLAEAPAVGAAQRSHRSGEDRCLAHARIEVDVSTVVLDQRVVLAQVLVLVTSGPGALGDEVDDRLERTAEAPEAAGALLVRLGLDAGRDVEQLADPIGRDRDGNPR